MKFFSSYWEVATDIPLYQQNNYLQKDYSIPLYSRNIFYLIRSIQPGQRMLFQQDDALRTGVEEFDII